MTRQKTNPKKAKPTRPIKIAALVIAAIQNLRETRGSTSGKIVDYITLASDLPQGRIKPQVKAALKRGVEYGVLKRFRGHYFLPSGDDLERADRVAARFAKLPTPVHSGTTDRKAAQNPDRFSTKKVIKSRQPMNAGQGSFPNMRRNVRRARSVPLSLTSTATGKSYYRDRQSFLGSDVD